MPITCWWSFRRIGAAIRHHHRPHKWIGRGAAHAGHHSGTATVVKVLVCVASGGIGGAMGWSSSWGVGASGAAGSPPAYYGGGESGPEWWSGGGMLPNLFGAGQVGSEVFTPQNGAEEAFGRVTERGLVQPVDIGFYTPKPPPGEMPQSYPPGIPGHPPQSRPEHHTKTNNVAEPGSFCALLTAIGLLSIARTLLCRQ